MKISGIDPDFINIIDYLDEKGYKPFASCDGVLANHDSPEQVNDAYISFLESSKIVELMAKFSKDPKFRVDISNSTKKNPYELYGNEIEGNQYSVYFSNKNGELTSHFEDVIMQVEKENTSSNEVEKLGRLSSILKDDKNSNLHFNVSLNSRMEPNTLHISTKVECEKRDMDELINMLYERFSEDEIAVDFFSKRNTEFNILFSDEQFEQILELISYSKSIEGDIPILEENKNFFSELFGRSTNSNEDTNTKFGSESVRKIVDTRRITNINKAYSNVKSREIDIRDNKGNIRDE